MYANNAVHEVAFNVENFNDMLYLKSVKSKLAFSQSTSIYHPNEIFACEVAHHIIDKTLPTKYINFLKKV